MEAAVGGQPGLVVFTTAVEDRKIELVVYNMTQGELESARLDLMIEVNGMNAPCE